MLYSPPTTRLPFCLAVGFLAPLAVAQQSSDQRDLYSLILVQRDLYDAQTTMTIFDTNEDGFIDAAERSKLPWKKDYADFDLNKDQKLTHMEVAVRQAKFRQQYDITQFDINNATAGVRQHDKNNNGQLDPNEIASGWPSEPEEIDKDSNGTITMMEYARYLAFKRVVKRELGIEAVDNMAAVRTLKRFDTDHDGKLDAGEYAAANLPRQAKDHDDDGDGKLAHIELAVLFAKHRRDTGLSKSDAARVTRMLQMVDINRDGMISEKEMTSGVFAADETGPIDYKTYDANKDGTVTRAEIETFIASERKRLGYNDSQLAEAKRLLLRHDQNRSNYIESDELSDTQTIGKLSKAVLTQADQDQDDKLSVEELAKHLAKKAAKN